MSVLRLIKPDGQPELGPADRAFLRDLKRYRDSIDLALHKLEWAYAEDDLEAGIWASRRLYSIGYLLCEEAQKVERPNA